MTNVARLIVEGGTFTFDADVPYDQQLLFEHAEGLARRQGSIRLDLDGVQWTVSAATSLSPPCSGCGARVLALSYRHQRQLFCPPCARTLCVAPQLDGVRPSTRKAPRGKEARRPPVGRQPPPVAR